MKLLLIQDFEIIAEKLIDISVSQENLFAIPYNSYTIVYANIYCVYISAKIMDTRELMSYKC